MALADVKISEINLFLKEEHWLSKCENIKKKNPIDSN